MFFAEYKNILTAKENRGAMAMSLVGGSVLVSIFSNFINDFQQD